MSDIEKLAKDIFGTVLINGHEYYELDEAGLKAFAESYHAEQQQCKASLQQEQEPVAEIRWDSLGRGYAQLLNLESFDTKQTTIVKPPIYLYTTPPDQSKEHDKRVKELTATIER